MLSLEKKTDARNKMLLMPVEYSSYKLYIYIYTCLYVSRLAH